MTNMQQHNNPVYTLGHSTRTLDELIFLLRDNDIQLLIDIRTVPKSRTNPQFNRDNLEKVLPASGIEYMHLKDLGGLRKPKPDSENTVWKNESFRGYADYMETDSFRRAVDKLEELAQQRRLAIMCAESVWWRCHRSMVSDELVARGFDVEHIGVGSHSQRHSLRDFAHVENNHVCYQSHHRQLRL